MLRHHEFQLCGRGQSRTGIIAIPKSAYLGIFSAVNLPCIIEPLSAEKHRWSDFSCEEPELNEFLHHRAVPEMAALASVCFVLVPKADPARVLGFYTLSAATFRLAGLPAELTAQWPQYPNLPATLLGRLARDQRMHGAGIGELLLVSAFRRALASTSSIGALAMVTDPKNARAEEFYHQYGFRRLGGSRRMFLTMRQIAAILEQGGLS
jgi:GNAT superfamily N-acetyltransferase